MIFSKPEMMSAPISAFDIVPLTSQCSLPSLCFRHVQHVRTVASVVDVAVRIKRHDNEIVAAARQNDMPPRPLRRLRRPRLHLRHSPTHCRLRWCSCLHRRKSNCPPRCAVHHVSPAAFQDVVPGVSVEGVVTGIAGNAVVAVAASKVVVAFVASYNVAPRATFDIVGLELASIVSSPSPPKRASPPCPPSRTSFPASPYSVSSPASPATLSSPSPPATMSVSFRR